MDTICRKEGQRFAVCKLYLNRRKVSKLHWRERGEDGVAYGLNNIILGAGDNHNICHRHAEIGPSRCQGVEFIRPWQIDMGVGGEVARKLGEVHVS